MDEFRFGHRKLLLIGFICVTIGAVIPFLIIGNVLPSTFFLNFLAFAISMMGVFLGVWGTSVYMVMQKHKKLHSESEEAEVDWDAHWEEKSRTE
jgi:mannose/fructose/N-acetylgalactosamine-specific phosphotransferase system component IIC